MSKKVGTAVIGAGTIAVRQHLPNLSRIPEAQLMAVCDVDASRAAAAGERFNARGTTTDHHEILRDPSIHVVVVAVRDHLQVPIAVEALRAGKHVYVEKPFPVTLDECTTIEEICKEHDVRVAVGLNKRFAPAYQKAIEVMRADGGPKNLHFRMSDDAWRWARDYPPGHLLALDVCHLTDLLRWMTRSELKTIHCLSSRPEDYAILIGMQNGTTASILFSGHATMDMPKERMDAICERGGVSMLDYAELRTYGYTKFEQAYRFAGNIEPDGEVMHLLSIRDGGAAALDKIRRNTWALREGTDPLSSPESLYKDDIRNYTRETIPNFLRDQGWLSCLRSFIAKASHGEETDHAGPRDAYAANQATEAAAKSLENAEIVRL